MFFNCSTCFGRHTAHHQELKNCNCSLWFYIRCWLPAAAMAQPSQRPATNNVCKTRGCNYSFWAPDDGRCVTPKHVEQLKNIGIINSSTQLHLVGSFYETWNSPLTFEIHITLIISMNAEAILDCCDYLLWVSNFLYFPSSSVSSSLLPQIISFLCFINKPINNGGFDMHWIYWAIGLI